MSIKAIVGIVIAIALAIAYSSAFFVNETEHVIVLQFGEYKRTLSEPGLNFKTPFVQSITRIEKRLLTSDAPQHEYFTSDKKRLVADPITRWRVIDALLFFKTVRDEDRARKRLDDLVLSGLRDELAKYEFKDIVGASRGPLMQTVTEQTATEALKYGIEVVDVRIKRADLPQQVLQSVFDRMKAEREKKAKEYRAKGQEEADTITAKANMERKKILANAYREAQTMYGEGDALSTKTYADAYGKDQEFYEFTRNLELYEAGLNAESTIVLSTGSDLFQYLTKPGAAIGE